MMSELPPRLNIKQFVEPRSLLHADDSTAALKLLTKCGNVEHHVYSSLDSPPITVFCLPFRFLPRFWAFAMQTRHETVWTLWVPAQVTANEISRSEKLPASWSWKFTACSMAITTRKSILVHSVSLTRSTMCSIYRFYGQILIGCIASKATKYCHITQLKRAHERAQKAQPLSPLFSSFCFDWYWLQVILIYISPDEISVL